MTTNDKNTGSTGKIGGASAGKQFLRGSVWMVGMRWTVRTLGLISTVILARLLQPEDIGLIAMAMVGIGFLEVFTHTGVDLALIRNPDATRQHFDSAWTLDVLLGIALAVTLVAAAPLAGSYFAEPRVVPVVRFLALRALIGGFENIGVVNFRRNLEFSKEFRFEVAKKSINFVNTVTLALILRSYWALVISMVASRVVSVGLSYVVHPFRPRLSFSKLHEISRFSKWMILARVGKYLNRKTDEFVVGGLAGATAMGSYHVGADVATAPTDELVLPMARGQFPVYSKVARQPGALENSFLQILSAVSLVCISAGIGMALVAEDMVRVVFGERWMGAVPVVHWLAVYGAIAGIAGTFETMMTVRAQVRPLAVITWIAVAVQLPILWGAGMSVGIEGIAAGRTMIALVFGLVLAAVALKPTALTAGRILGVLWPRILAGLAMAVVVAWLHGRVSAVPVVRLATDVATGATAYLAVSFGLWYLRGRPPGPEAVVARFIGASR